MYEKLTYNTLVVWFVIQFCPEHFSTLDSSTNKHSISIDQFLLTNLKSVRFRNSQKELFSTRNSAEPVQTRLSFR